MSEATAAVTGRRNLRVALMWGGAVQGEEVFRSPRSLVVGEGSAAVFPLPEGATDTRTITILKSVGGQYRLVPTEDMDGDVWIDGERTRVRDLDPEGVPIGPEDYGMVTVGPIAVFFQQVTPPQKVPAARSLPDPSLFASLALALFLHGALLIMFALARSESPSHDALDLPPDLIRRFMVTPPPTLEEPPPERVERTPEKRATEPTKRPRERTEPQERTVSKVANQHLRQLEQARATTSATDRLMNALRTTERQSVNSVVGSIGPVRPGSTSLSRIGSTLGTLPGGSLQIATSGGTDIATAGGAAATKGAGRLEARQGGQVRGSVRAMQAMARMQGGELDRGEVLAALNRAMGRVQGCYERALNRNPSLAGRVTFTWSIQPNGRAADVREQGSTLGDPAVSTCIGGVLRGIAFPHPTGGAVSITYPFILQRT